MYTTHKDTHNDQMVRLASMEALFNLVINGMGIQDLENETMKKLDMLYGPGKSVVYKESTNDLYNR